MGSCIGFLPYNFKAKGNATIFLGDAGSTVIGFILACVAVHGDWAESNTVVALISPILIFWILIFDMVHITFDRIINGKVLSFRQWIEYVGKDHPGRPKWERFSKKLRKCGFNDSDPIGPPKQEFYNFIEQNDLTPGLNKKRKPK